MHRFLARRLLLAVSTVFGVTLVIFIVMRLLPGDPLAVMYGFEQVRRFSPQERASLMRELGLDAPLYVQYGRWVKDVFTGRLGESFLRGDPISELLLRRGPITLQIGLLSVIIACLVGLPVGVISALRPNSLPDAICNFGAVLFLAIPSFWLGLLIVAFLIIWFGYKAPITPVQLWHDPWANFQLVFGPAVVMGLGNAAQIARMSRSSLFEVLREDYVRTARAKGLREQVVLLRHALRTAILPVITLSGLILGFAIGGSVVVEKAFAVPGLGRALVDAAVERDITVVQNLVLLYALVFVAVNLLMDISYALLDPRVRLE